MHKVVFEMIQATVEVTWVSTTITVVVHRPIAEGIYERRGQYR